MANPAQKPRRGLKILGIDPGNRCIGFACISVPERGASPGQIQILDVGVIRASESVAPTDRLGLLHDQLFEIASLLKPDLCVIEKAFQGENALSALRLGEARGALIAAIRRCKVPITEMTPAHVKKTVAGNGRADKDDVYEALRRIWKFDRGNLPHDASDAMAIALCQGLQTASLAIYST